MSSVLKLYDYTDALQTVEDWLIEAGGELTPEIEALLAEAEGDFDAKAERVALKVRELEASAKAVAEEADRLAARAKAARNGAASLKGYLQRQMEAADRPRVDGKLVTLALQNNPPSVVTAAGPEAFRADWPQFVRVVPETLAFDKRAIIEAAKAGLEIPEGLAVVQTQSLRIR